MGSFDCVGASHSLSPHFAQDEMRLQGANLLSLLRAFGAGRVAEWIALGVDLAAKVFEDVVGHLGEDIDDLGIELTARPGLNFLTSFGESAAGPRNFAFEPLRRQAAVSGIRRTS